CRHRTMDFVAACKNLKKDKPCTIKFCHKCLWNRYGEKTEDVAFFEDWNCPKCRGICNCSFCRSKDTNPLVCLCTELGQLVFFSVSEILHAKGPENFGIKKIVKGIDIVSKKEVKTSQIVGVVEEENKLETRVSKGNKEVRHCRKQTNAMKFENKDIDPDIPLPQGTELTTVAGMTYHRKLLCCFR
ncbi:Cell division cycle-associated protein 7, partial [Camellia lanceoleosa]